MFCLLPALSIEDKCGEWLIMGQWYEDTISFNIQTHYIWSFLNLEMAAWKTTKLDVKSISKYKKCEILKQNSWQKYMIFRIYLVGFINFLYFKAVPIWKQKKMIFSNINCCFLVANTFSHLFYIYESIKI